MKSIITDTYTSFGSYNLSAFARVANWEELCIVDTTSTQTTKFDALWGQLPRRAAENFFPFLQNITPGPRRRTRIQQRDADVRALDERERQRERNLAALHASRQDRELEEQKGH